ILELRVLELGGRVLHEAIAELVEVLADRAVLDERVLLPDLRGRLAPELHVLLRRELVLRRLDPGLRARRDGGDDERQRRGERPGPADAPGSGGDCAHDDVLRLPMTGRGSLPFTFSKHRSRPSPSARPYQALP